MESLSVVVRAAYSSNITEVLYRQGWIEGQTESIAQNLRDVSYFTIYIPGVTNRS